MTHIMFGMACEVRPRDPLCSSGIPPLAVVFLAIRMPRVSGIELLERLGIDRAFEVVFVTAHGDRILNALRLCAFDYLLKPIDVDELVAMVLRLNQKRLSPRRWRPRLGPVRRGDGHAPADVVFHPGSWTGTGSGEAVGQGGGELPIGSRRSRHPISATTFTSR